MIPTKVNRISKAVHIVAKYTLERNVLLRKLSVDTVYEKDTIVHIETRATSWIVQIKLNGQNTVFNLDVSTVK